MLDVTIRVTKSPLHLEQIHHIGIINRRDASPGRCVYEVYLDGEKCGTLLHTRAEGALVLLDLAMDAVVAKLEERPRKAAEEKGN